MAAPTRYHYVSPSVREISSNTAGSNYLLPSLLTIAIPLALILGVVIRKRYLKVRHRQQIETLERLWQIDIDMLR